MDFKRAKRMEFRLIIPLRFVFDLLSSVIEFVDDLLDDPFDRNIFFSSFSKNLTFDISVEVDLVVAGYSQIHVTSKEFSRVIYYYLSLYQRRAVYTRRGVHVHKRRNEISSTKSIQ